MKFTGFQRLLHRKFLIERRWRVEEIAPQLGVGRSTLYAWIDGVMTCPVDILPSLFLLTRDTEFLQFCLQGTGYTLAPLPGAGVQVEDVQAETLDVMDAVGQLASVVRQAAADGTLDRKEREAIREAIRHIQREAEEVLAATTSPDRLRVVQ